LTTKVIKKVVVNATLVVSIIKNIVVNVKNTLLNIKNIVLNVKNIVLNIKNTLLIIKNIVLNATEVAEIVENVAVHAASATRHTRTNTVHAGPTPAGPASQGRRAARAETKGTWAPAVALALGVAALALGGCGERQSAVRAAAQAQLRMIGQASTIYAQDHGAELLLGHGAGGAGHEVRADLRLGEGDHVADVVRADEVHDEPVEAEGDARVRRRAVRERLEQEAELLLACSGERPSSWKTLLCTRGSWMRTLPPAISWPLSTMS
jgi:hypothetical protein